MIETASQFASIAAFVPVWVRGVVILALSVAFALILHAGIVAIVRRSLGGNHADARALLRRIKGLSRFAFVILALDIALPLAPINHELGVMLSRAMRVGFITLTGWIAIATVEIAALIYLRRFQVDADDNLLARKHVTQMQILKRAADTLIVIITLGAALMTFDQVRQFGVSLFASAGVAGLAVGLAARPLLSNLIAGIQIAMTQPIRIDDAVVVENEWGWIEEITSTYVVIKLWDWRRLIVPLSYFMEKPFQNWTRKSASIIGTVMLHADYTVPVERVREKLGEIAKESKLWDGKVVSLQVTDAGEHTLELRALVSATTSPRAWDLRCEVREKLIAFLQAEWPNALPLRRQSNIGEDDKMHLQHRRALVGDSPLV